MPLMIYLTWMGIKWRKALIAHRPMIMIVSGYTLARKISMENPDQREWVPTSLCESPSLSSQKESVTDLKNFVVIWEVISVLWCSTLNVLIDVSRVVTGYESSRMIISAHMRTGHRVVVVLHCVTVAFLTQFSVCGMSGRTYRPDGGPHCRVGVCGVLCKDGYPPSEGCVWICPPLSD